LVNDVYVKTLNSKNTRAHVGGYNRYIFRTKQTNVKRPIAKARAPASARPSAQPNIQQPKIQQFKA